MSSELQVYLRDVRRATSHIFRPLHREIDELAVELLDDGIFVERIWFAVTGLGEERLVVADCYDEDGLDVKVTARWKLDPSFIGSPRGLRYTLEQIEIEEL